WLSSPTRNSSRRRRRGSLDEPLRVRERPLRAGREPERGWTMRRAERAWRLVRSEDGMGIPQAPERGGRAPLYRLAQGLILDLVRVACAAIIAGVVVLAGGCGGGVAGRAAAGGPPPAVGFADTVAGA